MEERKLPLRKSARGHQLKPHKHLLKNNKGNARIWGAYLIGGRGFYRTADGELTKGHLEKWKRTFQRRYHKRRVPGHNHGSVSYLARYHGIGKNAAKRDISVRQKESITHWDSDREASEGCISRKGKQGKERPKERGAARMSSRKGHSRWTPPKRTNSIAMASEFPSVKGLLKKGEKSAGKEGDPVGSENPNAPKSRSSAKSLDYTNDSSPPGFVAAGAIFCKKYQKITPSSGSYLSVSRMRGWETPLLLWKTWPYRGLQNEGRDSGRKVTGGERDCEEEGEHRIDLPKGAAYSHRDVDWSSHQERIEFPE